MYSVVVGTALEVYREYKSRKDELEKAWQESLCAKELASIKVEQAWWKFHQCEEALEQGWKGYDDKESVEILEEFEQSKIALRQASNAWDLAGAAEKGARDAWHQSQTAWEKALDALSVDCSSKPNPAYHDKLLEKAIRQGDKIDKIMLVSTGILPHHKHGEVMHMDISKFSTQLFEREGEGLWVVFIAGFINQPKWVQFVCVNPAAEIDLITLLRDAGVHCEGSNSAIMVKIVDVNVCDNDKVHEIIEKAVRDWDSKWCSRDLPSDVN